MCLAMPIYTYRVHKGTTSSSFILSTHVVLMIFWRTLFVRFIGHIIPLVRLSFKQVMLSILLFVPIKMGKQRSFGLNQQLSECLLILLAVVLISDYLKMGHGSQPEVLAHFVFVDVHGAHGTRHGPLCDTRRLPLVQVHERWVALYTG